MRVTRIPEMPSTEVPSVEMPSIEYVNRFTGARTSRHPGTPYFLAAVESERKRQGRALSPGGARDYFLGSLRSTHQHDHDHEQEQEHEDEHEHEHGREHEHEYEHEHEHAGSISPMCSKSMNDIMEGSADWEIHSNRCGRGMYRDSDSSTPGGATSNESAN